MRCPYCAQDAEGATLLEHLSGEHADRLDFDDQGDRTFFAVTCPHCGESYRRPIKKSAGDPEFVAEWERQIRLVAFDMLIHHVAAEHGGEHELVQD